MDKNHAQRFLPIIVALCLIAGILIGSFYANHFTGNRLSIINTSSNKLNDLLYIIEDQYVDKVNMTDLVEKAMPQILSELDPHSTYVSAKDVSKEMQDLKGSFSGIGIIFTLLDDTARVIRVIEGGPSETVGIEAGDRIVTIDDSSFVSKDLTNEQAMSKLKGPKDSKVKLGIKRAGQKELLHYTVTRGDIPVKSIDAAYMIDKETGYILINKFSDTTYPELLVALAKLNQEGLQRLIIDLRGNHGGFMAPAVQMANEFLPKNRLIVYTEGRKVPRAEYRSDGRGSYQDIPLIVLVDETSASSSEIFAAAIQDNDRGTVIGRRTFGKGLVQEPVNFSDGSLLRLTIARYYSPSGRCLQKPYVDGNDKDYQMDLMTRAERGEYFSEDSIRLKGKAFSTRLGRTVYDGGGVMPDIFIAADTLGNTSYFQECLYSGILAQFAYQFVDSSRKTYEKQFTDWRDFIKYLKKQQLPLKIATYAERKGIKRRNLMLQKSYKLFEDFAIAYILDDFYGTEPKIIYSNTYDPTVLKAIEVMKAGKAFPEKPESKADSAKKVTR